MSESKDFVAAGEGAASLLGICEVRVVLVVVVRMVIVEESSSHIILFHSSSLCAVTGLVSP